MIRLFGQFIGCLALSGLLWLPAQAASNVRQAASPLFNELSRAAPGLDREVLRHALAAMQCAVNNGQPAAQRLAVIDYSRPSTERRLWLFDLQRKRNKVTNLRLACARLDGLLLRPGETMSYWYLIGKPTAGKGYLPGMILRNGGYLAATGGGLCQLSNLIYWMTLHTPLTVVERHRHGYDVFPDANRTQPFGSGATCFYPYLDLMIRNDTQDTYQMRVRVGKTDLEGEWRVSAEPTERYEVVERNHEMRAQYWGGYIRHNELYRQTFDLQGKLLAEMPVAENDAVMMYSPYLEESKKEG